MDITGSISQLLKGLDACNISVESLIGLPINDQNGKKIGTVTSVNIDSDTWLGTVEYDIFKNFKEECKVSMEINPALKYREELIKEVQLVGQEIIDRAEDFGLEPINKEENK